MTKKFIFAALLVVAASLSANAVEPKIVVVDIQKIMQESTAAKALKSQLQKKRDEYQTQIKAKEDKLKAEEADLVKQKGVLSKEALAQKQKDFVAEINSVRREVNDKRVKLDSAYKQALEEIQKSVQSIINDMAEDKGFNLAIPTSQLIYASGDMDITKDVLSKLNEKLPSVSLKF